MTLRHFLSSDDVSIQEQSELLRRSVELKQMRGKHKRAIEGRSVGLIFEKPSTRTRVSFETAVNELGGHAVVLRSDELQLGRGETLQDTGRVLSRYLDAIVVRTFGQDRLDGLAETSTIPIINALTDMEHPCQALADVLTIQERFADLADVHLVYLGDGNNVCHSLMLAAAKAGIGKVSIACPEGFEPIEPIVEQASSIGSETGTQIAVSNDPVAACIGATVLYTDVWTSMGQEDERAERLKAFDGFQLSSDRLSDAAKNAIVLHCLPAHREEEIATEVLEGPSSAVWDQAENRLHVQKALIEWLVPGNRPG